MKTCLTFLLVLMLPATMGRSQSIPSDSLPKKVVFVIMDGISADQLKAAHTPFLDEIGATGGYSDAYVGGTKDSYSETPTISAVGYNSLLTGTWANKHNVWDNDIEAPNYHYPTIFRLYKDQYPKGTIGVFSSWRDNRTKLIGEGQKETNGITMDHAFDGLEHDTINYPHDAEQNYMKLIDYTVADHTAKAILQNAPDVSWVYLQYTDDMGHRFGDSERFHAAIHFEDGLVGKIWEAIKKRQESHAEDWLLIVTTDHGRGATDGKSHGGQSDRERSTWIVTNAQNTNAYYKEHTPAVVDILPTMVDFLNIAVPLDVKREWDGVSLVKPVDAIGLKAKKEGKNLVVTWKSLSKGQGKLYVSGTNHFKSGGKDEYKFVETITLENGQAVLPFKKLPKGFFKLVLETPNTLLNTWLIEN